MADAPGFLKGLVNLRRVTVPVVDWRIQLNCATAEFKDFTVVIVRNVRGRVVCAVVDSVSGVVALNLGPVGSVLEVNATGDNRFITGIASVGERRWLLMDIETPISSAGMDLIAPLPGVYWRNASVLSFFVLLSLDRSVE